MPKNSKDKVKDNEALEESVVVEETAKEEVNEKLLEAGVYKGYSIRWLKEIGSEHPDFKLIAEYEEKYGEIK